MDKLYNNICKNKTSYYTFILPIKIGLLLCSSELYDEVYERVEEIGELLGHLFQAQDDYIDCYGDVNLCGKESCDIKTKKCSWLLKEALLVASAQDVEG